MNDEIIISYVDEDQPSYEEFTPVQMKVTKVMLVHEHHGLKVHLFLQKQGIEMLFL
jgi:hypothetical protein